MASVAHRISVSLNSSRILFSSPILKQSTRRRPLTQAIFSSQRHPGACIRRFTSGPKFSQSRNPLTRIQRWTQRKTFYREVFAVATVLGGFYIYNLETVPVSGRRRFNVVSPEWEHQMGDQEYESILQEFKDSILPDWNPQVRLVKQVLRQLVKGLEKLEKTSEFGEEGSVIKSADGSLEGWQVHVISSDIVNAFVLPGNKVFVFTGILPICEDEAGIATVLGHEISHNLCHHAAESVSSGFIRWVGLAAVYFLFGTLDFTTILLADLAFSKPRSRRQESEADQVGLTLMALSCYDPREAVPFWERMRRAEKVRVPEFVSTHPSGERRVKQFEGWMDSAIVKYQNADCQYTSRLFSSFNSAWRES